MLLTVRIESEPTGEVPFAVGSFLPTPTGTILSSVDARWKKALLVANTQLHAVLSQKRQVGFGLEHPEGVLVDNQRAMAIGAGLAITSRSTALDGIAAFARGTSGFVGTALARSTGAAITSFARTCRASAFTTAAAIASRFALAAWASHSRTGSCDLSTLTQCQTAGSADDQHRQSNSYRLKHISLLSLILVEH
jgi:hypothetical protein